MEPRGVGMGWLCIAVLCSGAAFVLEGEGLGHQSTTKPDKVAEPTGGDPTPTTSDAGKLMTWPTATSTPPWATDPATSPVPTRAGTTENKTQNASAVPIRYWSPVIFVVVALLVLFFTYRRTQGEGSRDRATSASDCSDLGALDHLPVRDTTPIMPVPQEERKGPEQPPAPEHTETTFCQPDPPLPQPLPPQPDTPAAAGGPRCSGEPGAD